MCNNIKFRLWSVSSSSVWQGNTGHHRSVNHFYTKMKGRYFLYNNMNSVWKFSANSYTFNRSAFQKDICQSRCWKNS